MGLSIMKVNYIVEMHDCINDRVVTMGKIAVTQQVFERKWQMVF